MEDVRNKVLVFVQVALELARGVMLHDVQRDLCVWGRLGKEDL